MKPAQTRPLPRLIARGLALLAAGVLVACGPGGGGGEDGGGSTIIQNKGSDTMVNVAQVWAEKYREIAADVEVEVSGGGSGVGIAALTRGAVDIANASRDMKPQEMESAEKNTGKKPQEFNVGYDALAVYVHKNNPIDEIELARLAEIYVEGGTVTRWSELPQPGQVQAAARILVRFLAGDDHAIGTPAPDGSVLGTVASSVAVGRPVRPPGDAARADGFDQRLPVTPRRHPCKEVIA